MSTNGELDPMPEHRTKFTFKRKRKHITKVNIKNMAYPTNHIISKYHMVQEILSLCQIP